MKCFGSDGMCHLGHRNTNRIYHLKRRVERKMPFEVASWFEICHEEFRNVRGKKEERNVLKSIESLSFVALYLPLRLIRSKP